MLDGVHSTRADVEAVVTSNLTGSSIAPSPDHPSKSEPFHLAEQQRDEGSLPPIDQGWHAWRFVLAGCLLDTFVWGGTFAYGTWLEYYLSHAPFNDQSSVALASVGTIALALNYGEMLIGIILCRKWPHLVRKGMWLCLIVYSGSLLIASFAQQLWTLILFQGVLAGSAGGLLYAPIYVYLSQWFQTRRALAGGTIFAGAGFGGFAFPLILNALLPPLGFRWTLRIFALVTLLVCALAAHWVRPRLPIIKPPASSIPTSDLSAAERRVREEAIAAARLDFHFLYDPSFLLCSITVLVQGFMYSPILTYLPTYLTSFESTFLSSLTLSLMNIASIPGLMITGRLCDRYPYTYVQFTSALISTITIFTLLRTGDNFIKTLFFALLIGMTAGGYASTWFPASIDISTHSSLRTRDESQTAPIFGYLSIVRGIASITGPIIAGKQYRPTIVKGTQTFGYFGLSAFVKFVGIMGCVTLIMCALTEGWRAWRSRVRSRKEREENGKEEE